MGATATSTPRSAHATIRGYWWQFLVSCMRWFDLDEDSYMVCEGVEDIDIYSPIVGDADHSFVQYEQLKDYQSKNISAGNKDGREILANFASRYVEDLRQGNQPSFTLTTTAKRAAQQGKIDVIKGWQTRSLGDEPEEDFLASLRQALEGAVKDLSKDKDETPPRALEVEGALAWFDEEGDAQRWTAFLDSVTWLFEQDDVQTLHPKLIERVNEDRLTARAKINRLLVELVSHVSLGADGDRRFDRERLEAILNETQEEYEEWASTHAQNLTVVSELLELSLAESQVTRERLSELSTKVDSANALLQQLIDRGLLEASPFGLESATPTWDELKLHTRAVIDSYPHVRVNQSTPLPRATTQQLEEDLAYSDTKRLFVLEGEGGSGKSTALVMCAKHLLDEPDNVVLLLNLEQVQAGTPLERLIPARPERTPDHLLLDAMRETGRSRGILVIDQLDRLSQVSASSKERLEYFEQIKQLIMRTIDHEDLRVLVACRAFDMEVDPRMTSLKDHELSTTQRIGPLNAEDVRRVVSELGYSSSLTLAQLELLSIPLHLHLLSQLERENNEHELPLDEYRLYERFWDSKERASRRYLATPWGDLHENVCEIFLSKGRRYVTRRDCRKYIADIERLVSEDVFRRVGEGFAYFHQRYEEYVFALYFDGDLIEYILAEGQSFLAMDQTRAILVDRRHQDIEQYTNDLRSIMFHDDVQAHYKWIVRGLLATEDTLHELEFNLWCDMLASGDGFIEREALRVLHSSPTLMALFDEHGLFEEIFVLGTCRGVSLRAEVLGLVRLGLFQRLFNENPDEGAAWFSRLLEEPEHFEWLGRVLGSDHCYSHRAIFEAFLEGIRAGLWTLDSKTLGSTMLFNLPKQNAVWVPETISACIRYNLDRLDVAALLKNKGYIETQQEVFACLVDQRVFPELANQVPDAVLEHFTPLLQELLDAFTVEDQTLMFWDNIIETDYPDRDALWLDVFLVALDRCQEPSILRRAAETAPSITSQGLGLGLRKLRWRLLEQGDAEHLRLFAAEFHHLMTSGDRLRMPDRLVTVLRLLQTSFEKLPEEEWRQLLEVLLAYRPMYEGEPYTGERERVLFPILTNLPARSLTEEARTTLEDFSERLPEDASQVSPPRTRGGVVNEIDNVDLGSMEDEELLDYILHANPTSDEFLYQPNKFRTIQDAASRNPERFVLFLNDCFDDVPKDAKNAILGGWGDAMSRHRSEFDDDEWEQILGLTRRVYDESSREIARNVSFLLQKYPKVPPTDVVDLVVDAMLNHQDPEEERWDELWGLDIAAIDCVRGRMADILGGWVNKSSEVFEHTREQITEACQDQSTQVRAGVAGLILGSIRHDREFALESLFTLLEDQPDELLATRRVTECFRCMLDQHLEELNPVIERMLSSDVRTVRENGGTAYGLSTFVDETRLSRLRALCEDELIARGVAKVWKRNIQILSENQIAAMIELFVHPADSVLKELVGVFREMKPERFLSHPQILDGFLDARIVQINTLQLFSVLGGWGLQRSRPDIVLRCVQKIFELSRTPETRVEPPDLHSACKLLVEIYQLRGGHESEVLALLSDMVQAGVWGAEAALKEILEE